MPQKPRSVEFVFGCRSAEDADASPEIKAVLDAVPMLNEMYTRQGRMTIRIDNPETADEGGSGGA